MFIKRKESFESKGLKLTCEKSNGQWRYYNGLSKSKVESCGVCS